jgi:hypothetical protein
MIEQRVIVKAISDKVMLRYESEGETFAFILSNTAAMQLSGMLENAAKSKKGYEVGISI